jgi:hypothetical protein
VPPGSSAVAVNLHLVESSDLEVAVVDLSCDITINAPRRAVRDTRRAPTTYVQWARAFSPSSSYRGERQQGSVIDFIDPDLGGTGAILETVEENARNVARHVAVVGTDATEYTTSEMAAKWIRTVETDRFDETEGSTTRAVEIRTHEDFVEMFSGAWPQALDLLEQLCEAAA